MLQLILSTFLFCSFAVVSILSASSSNDFPHFELGHSFANSNVQILVTGIVQLGGIAFAGESAPDKLQVPNPSSKSVYACTTNGAVYEIAQDGTGSSTVVRHVNEFGGSYSGACVYSNVGYTGLYYGSINNGYAIGSLQNIPLTSRCSSGPIRSMANPTFTSLSQTLIFYSSVDGIGAYNAQNLGVSCGITTRLQYSDLQGLATFGSDSLIMTLAETNEIRRYNLTNGDDDLIWSYENLDGPMIALPDDKLDYLYIANNGTRSGHGSVYRIHLRTFPPTMELIAKVADAQSLAFDDSGNLLIAIRSTGTILLVQIPEDDYHRALQ
jgi:hypothetical protein